MVIRRDAVSVLSLFMFLFFFDLFLFGGGRVVEFSGITFRMIIFPIAMFLGLFSVLFTKRINTDVLAMVICFMILLCYSSLMSSLTNDEFIGSVITYSFFFLVLFFDRFPDSAYRSLCRLIPYASILMSVGYLAFLVAVAFGAVSFLEIYNFFPDSELFLRGTEGFVYKGFIYILVGCLYFVIVPRFSNITRVVAFIICFAAVLATLTRGFVVSLLFVLLIFYIWNSKWLIIRVLVFSLIFIIPVVVVAAYPEIMFREGSDDVRLADMFIFLDFLDDDIIRVLIGNGIGGFFGDRPMVENFVMDFWFRFGLVGLILILLVYLKITLDFRRVYRIFAAKEHVWIYFSVLLIYVQSIFNPYVNNYIGGVFVVFSLVYFNWLLRTSRRSRLKSELIN